MKSFFQIFNSVLLLYFISSTALADTIEVGAGFDNAGPVGGHITTDLGFNKSDALSQFRFGLELATRGYRYSADSLTTRNSIEGLLYSKAIQPVSSNLALYEKAGLGWQQLPRPADKSSVSIMDAEMGLRVDGIGSYVEIGTGVRWLHVDSPVQVGIGAIDTSLLPKSSVSFGWSI
jgi:hypothetical protein